jgi:chemotaxis protein CheX
MAATLTLRPVLDSSAAAALREELLARRGQPLALDGGAVERLGGLCLQVLLSAYRTWRADGAAFVLSPRSTALTEALARFGASDLAGADA